MNHRRIVVAGKELIAKVNNFRETSQYVAPQSPSWLRGFFCPITLNPLGVYSPYSYFSFFYFQFPFLKVYLWM